MFVMTVLVMMAVSVMLVMAFTMMLVMTMFMMFVVLNFTMVARAVTMMLVMVMSNFVSSVPMMGMMTRFSGIFTWEHIWTRVDGWTRTHLRSAMTISRTSRVNYTVTVLFMMSVSRS